jgi:GDP-4-dehydro-6-deoxy-D-mannose reductase
VHHVASGVPIRMRELLRRHLAAHGLDVSIVREASELSNRVGYDVPAIYANVASTMQLVEMEEKCRSLS